MAHTTDPSHKLKESCEGAWSLAAIDHKAVEAGDTKADQTEGLQSLHCFEPACQHHKTHNTVSVQLIQSATKHNSLFIQCAKSTTAIYMS